MDGKNKYFVERVNDIKHDKQKRQYMYFIKWRGYTEPSWEPIDFVGRTQAIKNFYELHIELLRPCLAEARV